MNPIKKILFLVTCCFGYSCNQTPDLSFEANKIEYIQAVNCLIDNYTSIFSTAGTKNSVDIYNTEKISNKYCESFLKLLERHSIAIVSYERDSTILFYSKNTEAIKSKQAILVFTNNRKKLDTRLTSDMKLKSIKGNGWYELEKIISLAN